MSVDLSKLSPAPWSCTGGRYIGIVAVVDGKRSQIGRSEECADRLSDEVVVTNGTFIALARNAFDVQLRRGWTARRISNGRWLVQDDCNTPLQQEQSKPGRLDWFEANDPFSALTTADEWYRTNMEAPEDG
jgi:hypothetical protein